MTSRNPDRDRAIVLMREAGMTVREIGKQVGLSHQTVSYVIDRAWRAAHPVPVESLRPHDRIYHFAPSTRAGHAICAVIRKVHGETPDDICPQTQRARWRVGHVARRLAVTL